MVRPLKSLAALLWVFVVALRWLKLQVWLSHGDTVFSA